MRRSIFFIVFTFIISLSAAAQQNRFIYIQTDNKQPFYVRVNNNLLSSSSSGYVVIPKLTDGTYTLDIGFPKNEFPAQKVQVSINKKDAGYVLKNFGEKGWGLFNLQTMDVIMGKAVVAQKAAVTEITDDVFTSVLADVVNTPSLKNKEVIKEEVKKSEPIVAVKQPDPPKKEEVKEVAKVQVAEKPVVPAIRQLLNKKGEAGRDLAYIDNSSGIPDTIRIFIEDKRPVVIKEIKEAEVENPEIKKAPVVEEPVVTVKKPANKELKEKFIEMELGNPNAADTGKGSVVVPVAAEKPKSAEIKMINSDCRGNAENEDFLKLRKKMASGKDEEDMIDAARKAFKAKCYSTEQIKNLGFLFLKDAGRYKFFDASYPFVHDSGNFSTLQQQLTDPYYITRFQAMIRK